MNFPLSNRPIYYMPIGKMSYNLSLWGEDRYGVGAFYFDSPQSIPYFS